MKKFNIELHDSKITEMGVRAIIDFYKTMSIDQLLLPNVYAFVTGINSPFLNVVIDNRQICEYDASLTNTLQNFFDEHNIPWGWFITPAKYSNDFGNYGLSILEEAPAMYLNLSQPVQNGKLDEINIKEFDKNDDLKEWILPINEGFGVKEGDDSYRKLNTLVLKKGTNKLKHFGAYYNDNIVASGTLFISNDSVMLHNLATKPAFKKRGFGTSLTIYMLQQAKALGFVHCFLDSSEDGFSMYQKLGFRVYSTTLIYAKAAQVAVR